jgi:cation:H+ antiporter
LGVGIVLGSNLFNLAALLGLGALVAGQVAAPSAGTLFNGAVALGVTVLSGALIAGFLNPLLATFLVLLIVTLNIYILAVSATHLEHLPIPSSWRVFLIRASREAKQETREIGKEAHKSQREKHPASIVQSKESWKPALLIGVALVAIVLGSIGLIKYATAIGQGWLPEAVLGTFVLASLTGLPNSLTAVRLAQSGKGSAVIAETLNSNTINIVMGLLFPALIFGQGSPDSLAILDVSFLIAMTLLSVLLSAHSEKLTRTQGILLIVFYAVFVGAWTILFMNGRFA